MWRSASRFNPCSLPALCFLLLVHCLQAAQLTWRARWPPGGHATGADFVGNSTHGPYLAERDLNSTAARRYREKRKAANASAEPTESTNVPGDRARADNDTAMDNASNIRQGQAALQLLEQLTDRDVAHADKASEPLLFIGVNTGPENIGRRKDVRHSWMKDSVLARGGPVQARFIVGKPVGPNATRIAAALAAEEAEHHDFLRLPIEDTYDGLTKKTFAFLSWYVSPEGPKSKFLMKLDDDTFPHFTSLLTTLKVEAARADYSYMGFFHTCALVRRDGKNAELESVFSAPYFPTYASGSGYVLSARLVQELIKLDSDGGSDGHAGKLPQLYNEDASVGVWVNKASDAVDFMPIPATLFGCNAGDSLSMNLRPGEMECMWNKRNMGKRDMCCDEASDPWPEDAPPRKKFALLQKTTKLYCRPSASLLTQKHEGLASRGNQSQLVNSTGVNASFSVSNTNLSLVDDSPPVGYGRDMTRGSVPRSLMLSNGVQIRHYGGHNSIAKKWQGLNASMF